MFIQTAVPSNRYLNPRFGYEPNTGSATNPYTYIYIYLFIVVFVYFERARIMRDAKKKRKRKNQLITSGAHTRSASGERAPQFPAAPAVVESPPAQAQPHARVGSTAGPPHDPDNNM